MQAEEEVDPGNPSSVNVGAQQATLDVAPWRDRGMTSPTMPPPEPVEHCQDCEYYIPITSDPGWGICRRHAPSPCICDDNRNTAVLVAYPKVNFDGPPCGEKGKHT